MAALVASLLIAAILDMVQDMLTLCVCHVLVVLPCQHCPIRLVEVSLGFVQCSDFARDAGLEGG